MTASEAHCEPCGVGHHDHCSGLQPVGCCCTTTCPTCGGADPADYINDPPHTLCPTCHGDMFVYVDGAA